MNRESAVTGRVGKGVAPSPNADWLSLCAIAFVVAAAGWDGSIAKYLMHFLLVCLEVYLYVAVHEASHVVAAWALGRPVSHVDVGEGRKVFGFSAGQVPWTFRMRPSTGKAYFYLSAKRWKNVSILFAGPAIPLALSWFPPLGWLPDFRVICATLFLVNMMPQFEGSDGHMIRRQWRGWRERKRTAPTGG